MLNPFHILRLRGHLMVLLPIILQKVQVLPCSNNSLINHLLIQDPYIH